MDLTALLSLVDGNTVAGGVAGSGGAVSILGILIRQWLKSQNKAMADVQASITASRTEARADVTELKENIHCQISTLKETVERQMQEFQARVTAQELELKHQDKATTKLELRLALVEERAANSKQLHETFEAYRERTNTAVTSLIGRTDALYDILKGKRKMWDKDGGEPEKSAS